MKTMTFLGMTALFLTCAGLRASDEGPAETVKISLKVGIKSSFGGPQPPAKSIDIVATKDRIKFSLHKPTPQYLCGNLGGTLTREQFDALMRIVERIWDLPQEPKKYALAEDLYGLNIGITVERNDQRWVYMTVGGCIVGEPEARPTAEQKKVYREIAEAILSTVEKAPSHAMCR